jgi:hypothetical protein
MSRTKRSGFYIEASYGIESDFDSTRDKKKGYKPDKPFKKQKARNRKAKVKDAINKQKELPIEKKTDVWDWN